MVVRGNGCLLFILLPYLMGEWVTRLYVDWSAFMSLSVFPNVTLGINSLGFTSSKSQAYINGAVFNSHMAVKLFTFSQLPNWKEELMNNPMALFFQWDSFKGEPFSVVARNVRSEILCFALWESVIESDAYYACLCTDSKGVVKSGYWKTWAELCSCLPLTKISDVKDGQEALFKLQEHRKALFLKYFSPVDTDFILATIPNGTCLE
jgi:hypothetical protein